jgi:ribonucleotide monophosphatase NagD (HAD superfamily)
MLGDQVMTDIVAGHAAGLPTILVRTGVAEKGPFPITPDFDIETLAVHSNYGAERSEGNIDGRGKYIEFV